ncbi:pentatricopeptide repeat-containing protein [Pyrus ussuriensis x Pyrus communis]|uniref:Pentatricopeptide repeat-containing protein n=1 Tax=Pyrus ussuriensis x Pyrus communis TaxID=2448454 RepID=A0A5N5G9E5_9ROSA|nr:pentatricopeptide repeat-containing protein [Pyrus ussuriensis x Pyrus communis]
MGEAVKVFDEFLQPDVFLWTSMVTGYKQNTCALAGNLEEGKKIHEIVIRKCFELDIKVATTLIDVYMKFSAPEKAGVLFNRMPKKDVAHNGMADKSIGVFRSMLSHETQPELALERGDVEWCAVVVVAGVDAILKIVGIDWRERLHSHSSSWVEVQDLKNMRTGSFGSSSSSSSNTYSDAIGVVLNDPPETVTTASHGVGFDLNVVASVEEEESVGGTEIDRVTESEAACINSLIRRYVESSGQLINLDKSLVHFSANCPKHTKRLLLLVLNIKRQEGFGKYLGLQADFGAFKKKVFEEEEAHHGVGKGYCKDGRSYELESDRGLVMGNKYESSTIHGCLLLELYHENMLERVVDLIDSSIGQ